MPTAMKSLLENIGEIQKFVEQTHDLSGDHRTRTLFENTLHEAKAHLSRLSIINGLVRQDVRRRKESLELIEPLLHELSEPVEEKRAVKDIKKS